jgi:Tfp pilus assembly protein PilF
MEQEQRIQQLWQRGGNYLRIGNLPAAQASFEGILVRDPGHAQAQLQLAAVQMRRGSAVSAIRHGELALALAPDDLEAQAFLAKVLLLSGQVARARELALRATAGSGQSVAALEAIGTVLSQLGEHRRALTMFDAALSAPPFTPVQYFNRALAHHAADKPVEYEKDLGSCLALDPGHVKAHWCLAQLRRRGRGAAHAETLRKLLQAPGRNNSEREALLLALFHELDGLDRPAEAWPALEEAMATRAGQRREPLQWSAFRSVLTQALPPPNSPRGPIFVVGLPQSGVAVLGRLLERHPQVLGLGDMPVFSRRLNAAMAQSLGEFTRWDLADAEAAMAGLDFDALGRDYTESVIAGGDDDKVACESIPTNALLVGAIARALPQARFLHVTRDARDNGLSLLALPYAEASLANESIPAMLEDLRRHRELMQHWQDCLPGRVMDVQFESLVQKPEMVLRVVCAFLGLRYAQSLETHDVRDRWIGRATPYADRLTAFAD